MLTPTPLVWSGNIQSGQVGWPHAASGIANSGKIASGTVQGFFGGTRHIASGSLGVFDFGSGAVVAGAVGSGAIQSGNVASGQIGMFHLASGMPDIIGQTLADVGTADSLPEYNAAAAANRRITVDRLLGYSLTPPEGRLTLTSGTPVTTTDVTGAGTIYYTPYLNNRLCIYDGTRWRFYSFTEKSLSVSCVNGAVKSVFIYDNAGTLTLTDAYWTNSTVTITIASPGVVTWNAHGLQNGDSIVLSTTGALPTGLTAGTTYFVTNVATNTFQLATESGSSAINTSGSQSGTHTAYVVGIASGNTTADPRGVTTQNGVLVKSGDTSKLFLGVYRASGTNTIEDSVTKRFLWNAYNRVIRTLQRLEATNSWVYGSATIRPWNGSTTNRVELVVGALIEPVRLDFFCTVASNSSPAVGMGVDNTTQMNSNIIPFATGGGGATTYVPASSIYNGQVGLGYHYLQLVERVIGAANSTFFGAGFGFQCGATGWCWG